MRVFGELEVIFGTEPKEGVASGHGVHRASYGVLTASPSVSSTLHGWEILVSC